MTAFEEAVKELDERFGGGKDNLISLSTIATDGPEGIRPGARLVDAVYENGAFYITSYATSPKMLQIARNPAVAICYIVEGFTADAIGENLGWVCDEKNDQIMPRIRDAFAKWYAIANNDDDPNTCLLRVKLTAGLWNDPHNGIRKEIDFVNKTVQTIRRGE